MDNCLSHGYRFTVELAGTYNNEIEVEIMDSVEFAYFSKRDLKFMLRVLEDKDKELEG